jgi:hypothetical protein
MRVIPDGAMQGGVSYRFAIGRQSRDYIVRYMNYRRHKGEQVNDKSPLIKSISTVQRDSEGRFTWRETPGTRIESRPRRPQFINEIVVSAAYATGIQSEIDVPWARPNHGPHKLHEVHAYSLRVFWKRQMREGGIADADLLRFMMGQAPMYDEAYDKFDADYVRRQYAKAEPMLTVTSHQALLGQQLGVDSEPQGSGSGKPQRIVREEDLDDYLNHGWRHIATLPSGRIVVG